MMSAFKVVPPGRASCLDCQELFISNVVTGFGRIQGAGIKAIGMEDVVGVGLREDGADSEVTGVGLQDEGVCGISMYEDWGGSER